MTDISATAVTVGSAGTVEIPKRALFKAAEVCDIVKVQPYVLRTWEAEFPGLGVAKTTGGPRVYRRGDVERVVRIKHLLLVEGLTLAGARRRLEDEAPRTGSDVSLDELIGRNARERIADVKRGLRGILDLLGHRAQGADGEPLRRASPSSHVRAMPVGRVKAARSKAAARNGSARRKRSA
jgi:DNA-binding transcriptional MerR regulator